jgi:hypothetical protein
MRNRFRGRQSAAAEMQSDPEVLKAQLVDYSSPELVARLALRLSQGVVETPLLLRKVIESEMALAATQAGVFAEGSPVHGATAEQPRMMVINLNHLFDGGGFGSTQQG